MGKQGEDSFGKSQSGTVTPLALMFFFLLVVMVPKMKPKTVCAGRLFKTEANVLTGSLELGDCMAIL